MHNGRCFSNASSRRCPANLAPKERSDIDSSARFNLSSGRTRQANVTGGGAADQRGSIDDAADIKNPGGLCLAGQSARGLSMKGNRYLYVGAVLCARACCPGQIDDTHRIQCGCTAPYS
jgi:hypothetical protein